MRNPRTERGPGVNQRAQITLTEQEIGELLAGVRSVTLASVGPGGQPHLVAMWFSVLDHRKLGLPSSGAASGSTVSAPGRRPR